MAAPVPYLGSKISLISKSEIRYEGILYTIDAEQSIIALAKVQSFGTEDRPTEMPVPARNEVYEYIIFRGTDIKKIEVCETPKLHDDPAIVQHSAPTVASSIQPAPYNRHLGPIGGGMAGIGGMGLSYNYGQPIVQPSLSSSGSGFSMAGGSSSQLSELTSAVGEIGTGRNESSEQSPGAARAVPTPIGPPSHSRQEVLVSSRSSTPTTVRKSPVSDASVQVSPPPPTQQERKITPPKNQSRGNQSQNRYSFDRGQREYQSQPRRGQVNNHYYQQAPRQNQNYQGYYQNHPSQYYSGGRGQMGRGRAPRRGPPRGRGPLFNQGQRQRQDQQLFEKEFDFETANEEFEELRVQLSKAKITENGDKDKKEDSGHETATTGDESEESGPTCYDKTKSFFDSISCEAIERSKGRTQRPDWRQERKINVQTFGVATARRGYYPRGRGGYYTGYRRGYSQGGYYRGGGNYSGYRGSRNGSQGGAALNGQEHPVSTGSDEHGESAPPASGTNSYASAVRSNAVDSKWDLKL